MTHPLVDVKRGAVHDTCARILGREATKMAPSVPLPPPGFDQLSVDKQIDYVQSLWDRIATTPALLPVPEWHREVVDERLKGIPSESGRGRELGCCTRAAPATSYGSARNRQCNLRPVMLGAGAVRRA